MHRLVDHGGGPAQFDDFPEVHHGHPVGDVLHHRKVVGDEDQAQVHPPHQVGKEVEDLGLDRDVQGRDRLIRHQDLGLESEGAGDRNPLTLTSGKFVGVFLHQAGCQARPIRISSGETRALISPGGQMPWTRRGSARAREDVQAGIERGVGVLKKTI